MRKESGFTLIELIVVIVILGILAAFAVPRFVGMQDEARRSTLEGLTGSIRGASALAHGKALVNDVVNGTISVEGDQVDVVYSYPAANGSGIGDMIQDLSGFTNASTTAGGGPSSGTTITYTPNNAVNTKLCSVTYKQPTNSSDSPTIHVNATDCS